MKMLSEQDKKDLRQELWNVLEPNPQSDDALTGRLLDAFLFISTALVSMGINPAALIDLVKIVEFSTK